MRSRITASLLISLALVLSPACSDQSPIATGPGSDPLQVAGTRVESVSGCYTLSFVDHNLQPVTTLPVGQELILKAHVDNCAGSPAQQGSVTFQYCSLKGVPPNDITRADEAPLAACATSSATWKSLLSLKVNSAGDALMDFGYVSIPRTIGFRFKYAAQGGGISSGTSAPADFTWVPIS